MILERF